MKPLHDLTAPALAEHDPTTDASRLRAALNLLGWSPRYLAGRLGVNEDRARNMVRGREAVPPELLAWIEGAAAFLVGQACPDGWRSTDANG